MNRTCIIVPVYDHSNCLEWLVERLGQTSLHVFFINDGSSDVCSQLMRDLIANQEDFTLIERSRNRGKGAAVKIGLRAAHRDGFTHALQIDADGQHDLNDIPRLIEQSTANPEAMISGMPSFKNIPRLRYFGRYLTHVWVWINTWSLDIKDSMCGFRIYPVAASYRIIESAHVGDRMEFDTEIMVRLHWAGVAIVPVPTSVSYPSDGISHFRGLHDNLLISWGHTRMFFGMLKRSPVLLMRKIKGRG